VTAVPMWPTWGALESRKWKKMRTGTVTTA
jgi:hypothetical protein